MTSVEVTRPLRPAGVTRVPAAPARTLLNYLLLPRPSDLSKAVVAPLAFALGSVAHGGVGTTQLWRAALVWVVLELLVYQARYQWNDVRGFAADQRHPEAGARGRLPGPIERGRVHIAASLGAAALRLSLAAAMALAVPALRGTILAMTVAVFAVAFMYEHTRSLATGRTSEMPVPLRPALLGLWVAVGAGYAVRGLTGLALSLPLTGRPVLVVAAGLAMWALGVVFVTCRWALEAMCFASFDNGVVVWHANRSKAREHTLGLVRWLPSTSAAAEPKTWRALQGRTSPTAPWNLAVVAAAAAAAIAGRLLVGGLDPATGVAVAVVAGAVAAALTRVRGHRAVVAPAAVLALAAAQRFAGLEDAAVATLPWLVVTAGYALFTRQCANEIGRPLRRLEPLLRR